jgi:5S rRNA maturation endonuclease (ribonuclease M5)
MDRFEDLLEYFSIDLKYSRKRYYGCCPIHGGDKDNAVNVYHEGNTYRGNWKCYTMQCEKHFKQSIIGFVRGVLSHKKYNWTGPGDQVVSFNDTVKFLMSFVKANQDNLLQDSIKYNVDKNKFVQSTNILDRTTTIKGITREQIRSALSIPAKYYLQRGYTQQILDDYDIGLCNNAQKPMYNRIVVPIYDDNYKVMIGCSGRSIFPQCQQCKGWHNPEQKCNKAPKWIHSAGFNREDHLYNYWRAKQHILKTRTAIIVESPGNVWRLEEAGIHNSVALFGTALSTGQKILLDSSGALSLILLTDNDSPGKIALEAIREQCQRAYYIHAPTFPKNDIGEMTVEEINEILKPQIEKYND